MTPDFQIIANKQDITAIIRDRLLSLRVTDEAGNNSDTVNIQLDDRDGKIEWPSHGAEIEVLIGYKNNGSGLARMGTYIIDEIEHSGPPDVLSIRGKAANMNSAIKQKRNRSWELIEIKDIVSTIAAEHGLVPRVSDNLGSIIIVHIDQTDESDLHFLTRLAKDNGAIAKPINGNFIFVNRGESKSASGRNLPIINIEKHQIINHRINQPDRKKYKSARAFWINSVLVKKQPVIVGEGDPIFSIRHTYPTPEEAERAAKAKLEVLQRGTGTLSLTIIGNSNIQAEGKVNINGLRTPISGEWLITRVEHQFDNQGFSTRLDGETPNK